MSIHYNSFMVANKFLKVTKSFVCLSWSGRLFQSFAAVNLHDFCPYVVVLTFGTLKEFVFLKSYGVIVFSIKEFIFSLFNLELTIC